MKPVRLRIGCALTAFMLCGMAAAATRVKVVDISGQPGVGRTGQRADVPAGRGSRTP